MALTITDDWIRERVKLKHNNLEDVRSLSLPGTYHEKIGSMGDALRNFARLKALDISRNGIDSLQGLENLKLLEKLNLYYNNIPSLQELYRLRFNQQLQELDLRLNPVARNEPDYRLLLIHMLPNLRRLDDRAVRDSERKAALMHFTTDQAAELTEHSPRPQTPPTVPNPRTAQVKALAKPPTAVDNDEAVLLDYAGKTQQELMQGRQLTGSAGTQPAMEEYPPHVARQLDIRPSVTLATSMPATTGDYGNWPAPNPSIRSTAGNYDNRPTGNYDNIPAGNYDNRPAGNYDNRPTEPPSEPQSRTEDLLRRYPNLMAPVVEAEVKEKMEEKATKKNRVQFDDDPNLKFQDEIEAYTSYKAQGHFTSHPGLQSEESTQGSSTAKDMKRPDMRDPELLLPPSNRDNTLMMPSAEFYAVDDQPRFDHFPPPEVSTTERAPEEPRADDEQPEDLPLTGEFGSFMSRVSELADKYWNGSKSLLKNPRFKNHLQDLYDNMSQSGLSPVLPPGGYSSDVEELRRELRGMQEENQRLRERTLAMFEEVDGPTEADPAKSRSSFIKAQRDVSILRTRLQKSIEENKVLEDRIAQSGAPAGSTGRAMSSDVGKIQTDNETLKQEINAMNIRLKQANQMQELAHMLQESHKSLVETNSHLLRELDDTRKRHDSDVKQLHWSYDQLKKSVAAGGVPGYNPSQPSRGKSYNGAS